MKPSDHGGILLGEVARYLLSAFVLDVNDGRIANHARSIALELRKYGQDFPIALCGDDLCAARMAVAHPTCLHVEFAGKLRELSWEVLKISKDITTEGLAELCRSFAGGRRPPIHGRGWSAEHVSFDLLTDGVLPRDSAAFRYLFALSIGREAIYSAAGGDGGSVRIALNTAHGLCELVAKHPEAPLLIRNFRYFDEFTYTHGVNVALLTCAVGFAVGAAEERLVEMTMGALCHDVGKEKLPLAILKKQSGLTESEMHIMEQHSVEGARILVSLPSQVPTLMPVIACEHHMKAVSGGYPVPLPGHAPHPASLLVAIADAYDSLRTDYAYRRARTVAGAFSMLMAEARAGRLDKRFLPAFAAVLGLSEKGVRVRLSDGREASILVPNRINPLRPVLNTDAGVVDLAEVSSLSISGVFDGLQA